MFEKPLISEEFLPLFWSITKQAFNQRRKKIGNTLGKQKVKSGKTFLEIFQETGVDSDKRPQALTIEEWQKICDNIEYKG
jgi:16S rRNA A1518/A1519 N6-dimethyltransferase RsmA/KsgA/DIM1 with predicted DNA glycosylase/AP lyase activity